MKQFCHIPEKLNFTFEEFFKSDYATRLGIANTTSNPKILNHIMTTICCLLQPLRTLCNNFNIGTVTNPDPKKDYPLIQLLKPENFGIELTGGFRSMNLIVACKTKLKVVMSETGHPDGQCADIKRPNWSNLYLFCVLKALHKAGYLDFDQLIYEYDTNCCHVGYRAGANRHQIMIRKKVSGKFVYTNV